MRRDAVDKAPEDPRRIASWIAQVDSRTFDESWPALVLSLVTDDRIGPLRLAEVLQAIRARYGPPLAPRSPALPDELTSKLCTRCRTTRPLQEFWRDGTGHQRWCKACLSSYCRSTNTPERRERKRKQQAARRARAKAQA